MPGSLEKDKRIEGLISPPENGLGELPSLRRVSRIGVVEGDVETREIPQVLAVHARDQLLGGDALRLGLEHDGGAVRVVGAHAAAGMPGEALEAHPDVGLDVLHQVPQVDGTGGIGQGARHEQLAGGVVHGV